MIYKESPKPSLLVNRLIFQHSGSSTEPYKALWNSNSTPKVVQFYALSYDCFGFTLTSFPVSAYYDLLTKLS